MIGTIGKKYELGFITIPLSSLRVIDPGTLKYSPKDKEEEFYPLSDYAMKQMADILELPSKKFSSDLYELDQDLWKDLIRKKLISNNVKNSFESTNAMIINEEILNLFKGLPHVNDVLNVMNEYIESEELTTYTDYSSGEYIILISVNKDKVGTLIKYYVGDNYIVVYDCYYSHDNQVLILAPYYTVDAAVSEDTYQIANKEVCYNAAAATVPQSLESYINELKNTFLSAEEVINYFKKYLKIKLKIDPINPLLYGADNDYSNPAIENLQTIIDKLYQDNDFIVRINSNYVKKTIYVTNVSYYDMMKLFVSRINEGNMDINSLRDLEFACFQHTTHYAYLHS